MEEEEGLHRLVKARYMYILFISLIINIDFQIT